MNLSELSETINGYLGRHDDAGELRVVIETANGGIPTRRMVDVKSVNPGFDWTRGLYLFHTAEPVVVARCLEQRLSDFAQEQLAAIKSSHEKLGFKYLSKTCEDAWLDGFKTGIRAHVTSCKE